jgi:hypothetical protein
LLHQPGAGIDQVLAGVQDDQQLAGPQRVGQGVRQRPVLLVADPEDRRYAAGHQVRVRQVG